MPDAANGCGGTEFSMGSASIVGASVLQQVRVVDGRRPTGTEDGHDDREADHHLSSSDDHDEERDDLAVEVSVDAGERDQAQVDRVEHQLDAHEHDDRVTADENTGRAHAEQDGGQVEVVVRAHSPSPAPGAGPSSAGAATRRPGGGGPATMRGRLSGAGLPSGSSAGTSTALCRAYTPGLGIGVT